MSLFEIKNRFTGSVLFSLETDSLKLCVEAAVKNGSDLRDSDLRGAKIRDDITVSKTPIQVGGLYWPVIIWDQHMQIGCEFHSHEDWRNFTDEGWLRMGGKEALHMMREQFPMLIGLCDQHRPKNSDGQQS